jgi:hypothetical protein
MRRSTLILLSIIFNTTFSLSQDIITTKAGEDILAKISEVGHTEIKYKKFDNQDGPAFTLLRSDVLMIRYENGTKDIFNEEPKSVAVSPAANANLYLQGKMDADTYYEGYKGAGTGTLLVSLISPLIGLIPAIVCSSTRPRDQKLMYPDADLMKNVNYHNGYTQRAKKVKSKKVWKNWLIAFGVNVVLAIALQSH